MHGVTGVTHQGGPLCFPRLLRILITHRPPLYTRQLKIPESRNIVKNKKSKACFEKIHTSF